MSRVTNDIESGPALVNKTMLSKISKVSNITSGTAKTLTQADAGTCFLVGLGAAAYTFTLPLLSKSLKGSLYSFRIYGTADPTAITVTSAQLADKMHGYQISRKAATAPAILPADPSDSTVGNDGVGVKITVGSTGSKGGIVKSINGDTTSVNRIDVRDCGGYWFVESNQHVGGGAQNTPWSASL